MKINKCKIRIIKDRDEKDQKIGIKDKDKGNNK